MNRTSRKMNAAYLNMATMELFVPRRAAVRHYCVEYFNGHPDSLYSRKSAKEIGALLSENRTLPDDTKRKAVSASSAARKFGVGTVREADRLGIAPITI